MTRRDRGRASGLVLAMLVSLGACNGDDSGGTGGNGGTSSTSAPSEERTTSSTLPGASTATTRPGNLITVVISGGKVEGGFRREKVPLGRPIVLRVMSDTADEVHVHGYNIKADVAAGGRSDISFTPDIPGVFEVELEERKLKLLELEVQ
ncbi:MAG: hypothetical protein M3357_16895 [Actinomycetota bacterium]|nr:hypothetical protein [Actinomycetota bacterium]